MSEACFTVSAPHNRVDGKKSQQPYGRILAVSNRRVRAPVSLRAGQARGALLEGAATAGGHGFENRFHSLSAGERDVQFRDFRARHFLPAGGGGGLGRETVEEHTDFRQGEARGLGETDDGELVCGAFVVDSAAIQARRRFQHPGLLIETNSRRRQGGAAGQFPDGHNPSK